MSSYAVTISPKYQIVIPKVIRDELGLRPGQRVSFIRSGTSIRLVPVRPLESLMGSMPGLKPESIREKQDRKL